MESRSENPFSGPEFRRGAALFDSRRFFEAHEAWEELWRVARPDDRPILQGLIQIAAGFVKRDRGDALAARRLWLAGIEKLELSGARVAEIHLSAFVSRFRSWLKYWDRGAREAVEDPTIV